MNDNIEYVLNEWRGNDASSINSFIKRCHSVNLHKGLDYAALKRSDEQVQNIIAGSIFAIAYKNGYIVGIRGLQIKGIYGILHTECVAEDMRGKGINKKMGKMLIEYAEAHKLKYLLRSTAVNNTASLNCGIREGFIPYHFYHPKTTHYFSVYMRKDIEPSIYSNRIFCRLSYCISWILTTLKIKENGEKTSLYRLLSKFKISKYLNL